MGKLHTLPLQQQQQITDGISSRSFFRRFCSRIIGLFNFKCIFVLLLSIALFVSAVFWIIPHRFKSSGFDAKDSIKLAASTQAYFILEKPVSDIVPHIARLEYDILEEIAIPTMKAAILSVHGAGVANRTSVTFGFLPDPVDSSITPVYLSLLKSALLDLYLRDANLTLTSSIFGRPSSFEVLKCRGGITVMPEAQPMLNTLEILFNFTLHSSIDEIRQNFMELKGQLMLGLRLRPDEHVFLQVTNKLGSTKDPPVIIEASLYSDHGNILPQRLQQLGQIIMGSDPGNNLGLDNSVFGKVKQISLSSVLNHTALPPTLPPAPTPAPAPNEPLWPSPSPSPAVSSSPYSAPLPNCHRFLPSHARQHCGPHHGEEPSSAPSPIADPPSHATSSGPRSSSSRIAASPSPPTYPPKISPGLKLSPGLSPSSAKSDGSSVGQDTGVLSPQMSSSISSSSSSCAPDFSYTGLCLFWLFGLTVLRIRI